jgi:hypothetical protein
LKYAISLTICFSLILLSQLANARIPAGTWLNPQLTQDDGAFGKYYKGWLIVSDDSIDQIVTMGMHYDKIKLQILADDGHRLQLFDKNENSRSEAEYQVTTDTLKICMLNGACTNYQRTLEKPNTDLAPEFYPQIYISTKWCVDSDCESVVFKGIAREMLFNLNEGFKPVLWQYSAPERFRSQYGIQLSVLSYSYRFSNNSADLSSFMTSLVVFAEQDESTKIISRSGALVLRDGPLSSLQGTIKNHKISIDFTLEKVK